VSSLAADLVNTRPRPADPEEKLDADAARELLAAYGIARAPSLEELRGVRDELLRAFEARDMAELADALNPLLARGGPLRLVPGRALGVVPTAAADVVAVTAATELARIAAERGLDRLGFCAADDCQAVFADTSPRGDRHYCSRRCSTRMNVRRFRKQ